MVALLYAPIRTGASAAAPEATQERQATEAPAVRAASAILVNPESVVVLWSHDSDERRAMASTTKMMTALIAVEKLGLDDKLKVGKLLSGLGGSGLGMTTDEEFTVRQLIYSMMLMSANDAAALLAERISGGESAFATLMNERAAELGLKNTHYRNSHGLDATDHYSSARDLAKIAGELLKKSELAEVVKTERWSFQRMGKDQMLENRNQLLGLYDFATGIKTGHTEAAGYCLVSSAMKNGGTLVAVVLGAGSEAEAAQYSRELLEYGFSLYRETRLIDKGEVLKTLKLPYDKKVNLVASEDLRAVVREGAAVKTETTMDREPDLPISRGQRFGAVSFASDGKCLGSVAIVADRTVEPLTFFQWMVRKASAAVDALAKLFSDGWQAFRR